MNERLKILKIADFRVACIAIFVLEFSAMMVIPIIPLYSKTLGASATLIGSMFAGYAVGRMVSLVPGGYISDRKGDVTVAGVTTLCSALPPYLITLFLNPQYFIILRTIEGMFIGMAGPAFYSIVNRSINPKQRGLAMGIYIFSSMLGAVECLVGAAIMPTTQKMVGELYSDTNLTGKAFGIFLTLSGLGSILGPFICSIFYQVLNPRFVFGVVGIVGLLCLGIYLFVGIVKSSAGNSDL
ncbi:MAG: MFS transporter [Theionarchaea archaeon]|nr:MFS transporter [Theionarchaea archaeon]